MSMFGMSINLNKVLKAKQAESNLSIEALAKAVGVSTVSVRGVLSGKSKPNATTAKKYAAFLGIDIAELTAAKTAKAGKSASKKAAGTQSADKKSAGKKSVGKGSKGKARRSGESSDGLGSDLIRVAAAAADLLDDGLAVAVHLAGKTERDLIGRLLAIV